MSSNPIQIDKDLKGFEWQTKMGLLAYSIICYNPAKNFWDPHNSPEEEQALYGANFTICRINFAQVGRQKGRGSGGTPRTPKRSLVRGKNFCPFVLGGGWDCRIAGTAVSHFAVQGRFE